jgi:hypothetical protein
MGQINGVQLFKFAAKFSGIFSSTGRKGQTFNAFLYESLCEIRTLLWP